MCLFSTKNSKGAALGGYFLFPGKWKYVGRASLLKSILTLLISLLQIREKTDVTNLNDK